MTKTFIYKILTIGVFTVLLVFLITSIFFVSKTKENSLGVASTTISHPSEYLYPPLEDITGLPKEDIIRKVRVNTIEKRYKDKEMTKDVYEAKLDRAKKGIKEPEPEKQIEQEEQVYAPEGEEDNKIKDNELKIKE